VNEDTLVVVHCYAGDAKQVADFLPLYLHHGCPVLVLSPADAPVFIDHPQVTCRSAGMAGWKGAHTVFRQIEHWKIAAEFPYRYMLLHDADSVCLSRELPRYLYDSPDSWFWCNEIGTHYLNYEPPYFFSRETMQKLIGIAEDPSGPDMQEAIGTIIRNERHTLERLLEAADWYGALSEEERAALPTDPEPEFAYHQLQAIAENPHTLRQELTENIERGNPRDYPDWGACNAIDGFYVALTTYAGLIHRSYPDGQHGLSSDLVRSHGIRLIHGVKDVETLRMLQWCYDTWAEATVTEGNLRETSIREDGVGGMREGERIT